MSNQAILDRSPDALAPALGGLNDIRPAGLWVENLGQHVIRYSLVLVLLWMGLLKFAAYEAAAIQPMVAAHPLLSWLYEFFGVATVSGLIGSVEVAKRRTATVELTVLYAPGPQALQPASAAPNRVAFVIVATLARFEAVFKAGREVADHVTGVVRGAILQENVALTQANR